LLEKLTDPRFVAISKPSKHALELVRKVMETNPEPVICEVGVGIGATTIEFCRLLDHKGELHLFDYEDRLTDLGADIKAQGFENVHVYANTRRTFDSYSWALAKLVLSNRAGTTDVRFDFAYLDGGHMFHLDAPATVLLKELVKPGGVLLMDDYDWSIAVSPTMRPSVMPSIVNHYTEDQIETSHVALICSLFLDSDPAFEKINLGFGAKEHRRAYRKA
jgi:predicted O-methyltransferase YrrM